MADFQVKVELYSAPGIVGASASVNPIISAPHGRIAKSDCPVGGFVWDVEGEDLLVEATGSGKPLGFVHRDQIYTKVDAKAAAQNFVPAGSNVDIALKGDFHVICDGAKKGDAVYADSSTGAVATSGEATDFVFAKDADADGQTVICPAPLPAAEE